MCSEVDTCPGSLGLGFINLLGSEILEISAGAVRVEMTNGGSATHSVNVAGVVTVLNFHTCVVTHINIVAPCLLLCEVVLDTHVDVEGLIRFFLAVLDASQFRFLFGCHEFHFDAVLMAFFEKHLWEGMLLERPKRVVGISRPVTVCHCFFNS